MSQSGPATFLGLTAAERNARVFKRWPHLAAAQSIPPDVIVGPDGALLDISTAAARRAAMWRLLRASGKPTDGWLSRHIHRKVSRVCSSVLLPLGATANQATFLIFLVGAAGAWFMAQTSHRTMIIGTFLMWFASIADGIDGEMARLTLSESAYGEQLDTAVDNATHILGFGGLIVGWWRQGIGPAGWALAIGVAIGVGIIQMWTMAIVRRAKDLEGQFFVDTKPIELAIHAAAKKTGAVVLYLASGFWLLVRREAIMVIFFVVSFFTGQRVVYPLIMAGGIAIVLVTLAMYQRTIEQTITEL